MKNVFVAIPPSNIANNFHNHLFIIENLGSVKVKILLLLFQKQKIATKSPAQRETPQKNAQNTTSLFKISDAYQSLV